MAKSKEQYIAERTDDYEGDLYTFELVDAHTVERLQRDGDVQLPYKDLDKIKDERWNTKQFASRLLQGILNGDSVPSIAERLLDVVGYNEASAMRNARTMTTACENRGRQDSYDELADKGVVQKKVWIATPDDRTRESHLALDGEEVDIDDTFGNGLKYPADPDGDMSEVYNCRCSMRDKIVGFRKKDGHIEYIGRGRDTTTHSDQIAQERARRPEKAAKMMPTSQTLQKSQEYSDPQQRTLARIADAYAYHTEHNGLNRVRTEELPESYFVVNYGKISEHAQGDIANTLDGLMSKYDTPLKEVRVMTKNEFMQNPDAFAYVSHNFSVGEATMVLNPTKVKDSDALIERLRELKDYGYIPQIDDDKLNEYVVTHEFAHTFLNMRSPLKDKNNWVDEDFNKIRAVRKEVQPLYDEYAEKVGRLSEQRMEIGTKFLRGGATDSALEKELSDIEDQLARIKISEYSLTDADEFMAEAFAHATLGGGKNEYADKIFSIIEKNFGR